jgi:hypothetical protein
MTNPSHSQQKGETMSEQTEPVQVTLSAKAFLDSAKWMNTCEDSEEEAALEEYIAYRIAAQPPASPVAPATDYKRLATMLYRSLDRLSLAIESCAKIGFEESKPTTNAAHGAIWDDLNAAQKDAKLKLLHYQKFVAPVAPASAVKGICPACGEAIELSLAPSPVATEEAAQRVELFDAIQKVVAWEEEYRTLNHLGKVPPHPFIRLALLAAQLINVQHVPKTTAREFVAAYWRHRCGYEPASKFIPDAASIQDQIAIAEAALLTGAAQPAGTPDKGEEEPLPCGHAKRYWFDVGETISQSGVKLPKTWICVLCELHASFRRGRREGIEQAAPATEKLREALDALYKDSHRWSTRPCKTCDAVSTAVGFPFGCDRLAGRALTQQQPSGQAGPSTGQIPQVVIKSASAKEHTK